MFPFHPRKKLLQQHCFVRWPWNRRHISKKSMSHMSRRGFVSIIPPLVNSARNIPGVHLYKTQVGWGSFCKGNALLSELAGPGPCQYFMVYFSFSWCNCNLCVIKLSNKLFVLGSFHAQKWWKWRVNIIKETFQYDFLAYFNGLLVEWIIWLIR